MGATSAASEPGQGDKESASHIHKWAKMFAQQGDPSNTTLVFDSDAVLDPTELDIWWQLKTCMTLKLNWSPCQTNQSATGEETQKWWKSIVEIKMKADQRIPGEPQSRREQGLEHTWVSKQVLIVLGEHFFNITCQDASRIHS